MTIDELIQLAEGPEGPVSETRYLLRKAARLFKLNRPHDFLNSGAHREAALVLLEEALPGWSGSIDWTPGSPHEVLLWPPKADKDALLVSHDDFARALLIATLKAWRAVNHGITRLERGRFPIIFGYGRMRKQILLNPSPPP